MPSRKRKPYRQWQLWEIQEVRRLRDEEKLGFPEIGRIMGIEYNKCRMMYHTARTTDRVKGPTVPELRQAYDVPEALYRRMRERLMDVGASVHPLHIIKTCLLREGRLTPDIEELFQKEMAKSNR